MKMKCSACNGVYDDVLPDGLQYFHVCAPLHRASVLRAGNRITVDLADVQVTDTARSEVFLRRADHRDENVVVTGIDAKTGKATTTIKIAGAGAVKV